MPSDPQNNFRPGDDENVILRKILDRLSGISGSGGASTSYVDAGDAAALAAAKAYTDAAIRYDSTNLNVFMGPNAGLLLTTGISETAAGVGALRQVTSGNGNSAFGQNALQQDTSGANNEAFGTSALKFLTTGSDNAGFGASALQTNTTGSKNIGVGTQALFDLNIVANDGSGNNTAIGYNTGRGIVTGINNTVLGANVTGLGAALSNNVILADGSGVIRLQFDNLGVGTFSGDLIFPAGKVIKITSGANQRAGNLTLVGGTVTVANTTVTANTIVILTRKTAGGALGATTTYTVSAGVSFTVTSVSGTDTSTFSYLLIEVP